jgi:hypothetical protein
VSEQIGPGTGCDWCSGFYGEHDERCPENVKRPTADVTLAAKAAALDRVLSVAQKYVDTCDFDNCPGPGSAFTCRTCRLSAEIARIASEPPVGGKGGT